jgi:hypothetical protein
VIPVPKVAGAAEEEAVSHTGLKGVVIALKGWVVVDNRARAHFDCGSPVIKEVFSRMKDHRFDKN